MADELKESTKKRAELGSQNNAIAVSPLAVTMQELASLLRICKRHCERQEAAGKIGPQPVRFGASKRYVLDGPTGIRAWLAAGAPDRREWEARQRLQGGAT